MVKNLSAVQETRVLSLGWEDPLEKGMATHLFSCLENHMDREAWRASVHGIFQARILEWGAIAFSRKSSRPRD